MVAGHLSEVAAELIEHGRSGGRRFATGLATATRLSRLIARDSGQKLDDGLANLGKVGAEFLEYLGSNALTLADETEKDVLGTDVVVAELQRLAQAQLENLLGAGSKRYVTRG